MPLSIGPIGVWARGPQLTPELAAGLESLGYGCIWIGGSPPGDLQLAEELLGATTRITVATGIVNIWKDAAPTVAASYHRIAAAHPGRFLLGVGVGHPEQTGAQFQRPYEALVRYLDELDAGGVPVRDRALAALGPKVLRLAAQRSAGAHPYLTTPEHTRQAREILGAGVLLAPEQKVVLEADPQRARDIARNAVARPYLELTNYTNNLRRLGFTDDNLADRGSDALIDALVAHGDAATSATRITEHLAAGADHVAIQLLDSGEGTRLDGFSALAAHLIAAGFPSGFPRLGEVTSS
jgi:probable F420-dependent oxidoreductase